MLVAVWDTLQAREMLDLADGSGALHRIHKSGFRPARLRLPERTAYFSDTIQILRYIPVSVIGRNLSAKRGTDDRGGIPREDVKATRSACEALSGGA
jgi:hypothetical protein